MQVIREKIVTVNEALSLLTNRQKAGNLSYEQQNTLNYLEDLTKLDEKINDISSAPYEETPKEIRSSFIF